MSNMPTITFYINGSSITVSPEFVNPFFTSGTNGITQPPNWYYYKIPSSGTNDISINVKAATGYTIPALNFMVTGSGGAGGAGGTGRDIADSYYDYDTGGGGGGGGSGSVTLVNYYYSGINPTSHEIKLYPIGSYNSVMYLDNNGIPFYAYTGSPGGHGANYKSSTNWLNVTTYDNGDSANGGDGAKPPGPLTTPNQHSLPSYCGTIRGGAGGNGGEKNNGSNDPKPGANYNYAVGGGLTNDNNAYVPVTFADGLSANICYGGNGGYGGETGYNRANPVGQSGTSGPSSMFMLYFCL
jgi:hypothetical protein